MADLLQILDFLGVGRRAKADRELMQQRRASAELESRYASAMKEAELTGKQRVNDYTTMQLQQLQAIVDRFTKATPDELAKLQQEVLNSRATGEQIKAQTGLTQANAADVPRAAADRSRGLDINKQQVDQSYLLGSEGNRIQREGQQIQAENAAAARDLSKWQTGMNVGSYSMNPQVQEMMNQQLGSAFGMSYNQPKDAAAEALLRALQQGTQQQPTNPEQREPWWAAMERATGQPLTNLDQAVSTARTIGGRSSMLAQPQAQSPQPRNPTPMMPTPGQSVSMPSPVQMDPINIVWPNYEGLPQTMPAWGQNPQQEPTPIRRRLQQLNGQQAPLSQMIRTNSPAEWRYRRGF